MKLPRPRSTLRRLMVAVAIVGIAIVASLYGPALLRKKWKYEAASGQYSFYADRYDNYGGGIEA